MSFGDNLQYLRKSEGITQEELAEQLQVSRQTISKWESGGTYPEMEKLLQVCSMFGCSMDALVRGNVEQNLAEDSVGYDRQHNAYAKGISSGVFLVLFGISFMQMLMGLHLFGISEDLAAAVFFAFLIVAVAVFIIVAMKYDNFRQKHLYVTPFYTTEQKDAFKNRFIILIAAPTVAILLGVLFLIVCDEVIMRPAALDKESWELLIVAVFMFIIAASATTYTYAGMQYMKYDIENYNRENNPDEETKRKNALIEKCCGCIMLMSTLIYVVAGLGWHLWSSAWVVFIAGGILCAIVSVALSKNES